MLGRLREKQQNGTATPIGIWMLLLILGPEIVALAIALGEIWSARAVA
jgi:hypothetical protein